MITFAGLLAGFMAMSAGNFAEDFDSYPANYQLHGQGGWRGWDNSVAAGAFTTTTYKRSTAKSVDIAGPSDLVQKFTATSGQWQVKVWQFIPANTTGNDTYFILMNTYNDGGAKSWSTQVIFNFSTNLVYDNMGGAVGSVALVRDQWVPIVVDVDLDTKKQTIYYNGTKVTKVDWNRLGGVAAIGATRASVGSGSGACWAWGDRLR